MFGSGEADTCRRVLAGRHVSLPLPRGGGRSRGADLQLPRVTSLQLTWPRVHTRPRDLMWTCDLMWTRGLV